MRRSMAVQAFILDPDLYGILCRIKYFGRKLTFKIRQTLERPHSCGRLRQYGSDSTLRLKKGRA